MPKKKQQGGRDWQFPGTESGEVCIGMHYKCGGTVVYWPEKSRRPDTNTVKVNGCRLCNRCGANSKAGQDVILVSEAAAMLQDPEQWKPDSKYGWTSKEDRDPEMSNDDLIMLINEGWIRRACFYSWELDWLYDNGYAHLVEGKWVRLTYKGLNELPNAQRRYWIAKAEEMKRSGGRAP